MPSTAPKTIGDGLSPEAIQEMETYGIVRVPTELFIVGEYRYSKLEDAIAQGKRAKQRALKL